MSPCSRLLIVAILGALQVSGASSFNVKVIPEQLQVNIDLNHVTITCSTDVSLAGCEFHWIDRFGLAGPVLDPTRKPQWGVDNPYGVTEYNYTGRGLAEGDCGVTLGIQGKKEWMFGCRVRTVDGAWRYAWMELLAVDNPLLPVTATPREATVLPGEEVNLQCKSHRPLQDCWFNWDGRNRSSQPAVKRALYEGAGLERGECNLTLSDVTSEDNGPASCVLRTRPSEEGDVRTGQRFVALVVADPPSAPVLHVEHEGLVVNASCTVGPSRPLANITWLLGDEVIRQDAEDDSPGRSEDGWRWPWVRGYVTQNITRWLDPGDVGKRLRCVTSHEALSEPLETSEEIVSSREDLRAFTFAPEVTTFPFSPTQPTPVNKSGADENPSLGATCVALLDILCAQHDSRVLTEMDEVTRTKEVRAATCASLLEILCAQHGRCRVPTEMNELRMREARAAAIAAEMAVETGKTLLEAARSSARAEEARARKEELLLQGELQRQGVLQESTTVKEDVFTLRE